MNQLDHFVIAAADLQRAKEEFADLTGCLPTDGGAHIGLGTHNALASFGPSSYLEIVAPDPAQDLVNNMGAALAQLTATTPLHWAIRVDNLVEISSQASALDLTPGPIRDTSRMQPDGTRLDWQLMGLGGHDLAGLMPFYIDWLQCPHPATTNPVAGRLTGFEVSAPPGPIHELLASTEGVTMKTGDAHIRVAVQSDRGEIVYQADALKGFSL
jgi:hypothetical protein